MGKILYLCARKYISIVEIFIWDAVLTPYSVAAECSDISFGNLCSLSMSIKSEEERICAGYDFFSQHR